MSADRDLPSLLASMQPKVRPGDYVFVSVPGSEGAPEVEVLASVVESEGLTLVTTREQADSAGLAYDFVAGWITLQVNSALAAVGLTAAVSAALARDGISCNVLAGYFHDHLLVPADRVPDALESLHRLSRDTVVNAGIDIP